MRMVYEVIVAKDVDLNTLADVGDYAPGFHPVIIRAVALVITNTIGAAGVVKVDKRPTAGSDTGRGDGDIAVINLATTHDEGEVVYKDGLTFLLKPGEEAVFEVTDVTAASDTAHLILYVEEFPEEPANNTKMIKTT